MTPHTLQACRVSTSGGGLEQMREGRSASKPCRDPWLDVQERKVEVIDDMKLLVKLARGVVVVG